MWWIGFIIFLLAALALARAGIRYKGPESSIFRIMPFVTAATCLIAATEYLVLAEGYGTYYACSESKPMNVARYVSWLLSVPLLLLMLSILGGVSYWNRWFLVGLNTVMVLAGFCGAFQTHGSAYTWIFFAIGALCLFPMFHILTARAVGWNPIATGARIYRTAVWFMFVVFVLYGVVWLITDALGVVCVDVEILLYGLLDIAAKPILGLYLVGSSSQIYVKVPNGLPGQLQALDIATDQNSFL
jgi:bacteriorhodopsin